MAVQVRIAVRIARPDEFGAVGDLLVYTRPLVYSACAAD